MELIYEYSKDKDALLKEQRGISFEDVIAAIRSGDVLDELQHPNKSKYGHQEMFVVLIQDYTYLVPFVRTKNQVFLKTIFPSRKALKKYLKKDEAVNHEKMNYKLTDEERDLLSSFERDEWKSAPNVKQKMKQAQKIAENTIRKWEKEKDPRGERVRAYIANAAREKKDARINIRVNSSDLDRIKKIAKQEGLPYQTLIASVLHKFSLKKVA